MCGGAGQDAKKKAGESWDTVEQESQVRAHEDMLYGDLSASTFRVESACSPSSAVCFW